MSSLPRWLAVAALAAIVLVVAFGLGQRNPESDLNARPQEPIAVRPRPALAPQERDSELGRAETEHAGATLPASLRETDVDGWLGVDDDGHLVVTPGARWFFDYFLSATGEESAEDIRARIVAEIERRLPPAGAGEAVALLDRYLAYRERVRTAWTDDANGDLNQRLAALHQIRVDAFGASNAAILFGEEEQVQRADLQRRSVMSDTTLAPEERERRLQEIELQLPPEVRAARVDTFAPLHLRQDEQALREAGGSSDDIRALREQRFGTEAADRLAALDREQEQWRQRVDDYQRARQVIDADTALHADAKAAALDSLLAQRFTPQERLRVEPMQPRR